MGPPGEASECDGASATTVQSSAAAFSAAIDRVQEELKELGLWKFAGGYHVYHARGVRYACLSAYRSSE